MANYRTRTYIAGDWDHDKDAVDQLHKWNDSDYWSLTFTDAHDLTSSSDNSLNCTIKASLKRRLDVSKTFVLIIGDQSNSVTAGSCRWCNSYNSYLSYCARNHSIDYRSYIKYECDKAIEANIKIIVLYKSTKVDRSKCPEVLRDKGIHVPMIYQGYDRKYHWDYQAVKKAFEE